MADVAAPINAAADSRRLSVGMFFISSYDAYMSCLLTSTGMDRPVRCQPTAVTAYRIERFERTMG